MSFIFKGHKQFSSVCEFWSLPLLVTQENFTNILIRSHFFMTVWPENYTLGELMSFLSLSGNSPFWRVTSEQEQETYSVAQVSLVLVKLFQRIGQIQTEQLSVSASAWLGTQIAASLQWHLRKHTWNPQASSAHPRQATFTVESLGELFVLHPHFVLFPPCPSPPPPLFFFLSPESLEFVSSSFPVCLR